MAQRARKQVLLLVDLGPGVSVPRGEIRRSPPPPLEQNLWNPEEKSVLPKRGDNPKRTNTLQTCGQGLPGTAESNYVVISPGQH